MCFVETDLERGNILLLIKVFPCIRERHDEILARARTFGAVIEKCRDAELTEAEELTFFLNVNIRQLNEDENMLSRIWDEVRENGSVPFNVSIKPISSESKSVEDRGDCKWSGV